MSLTLTTYPATNNHTAFNDVVYGVECTRYDSEAAVNVSSIASNGGKLEVTCSAVHNLENNDIITLTGFTGLTQTKSRITVVNTTKVKCEDITYVAYSLSGATIQKTINNLNIRCTVSCAGTVAGVKYIAIPEVSGVFEFDISGILQDYINNTSNGVDTSDTTVNTLVSGATAASVNYTLSFAEYYDDAFDIPYQGSTLTVSSLSGATMRAHNFALQTGAAITDYLLTGTSSKFLTNVADKTIYLRSTEKFKVQFLCTAAQAKLRIVRYTAGIGTATIGSAVTLTSGRGTVTIDGTIFSTSEYCTLQILNTSNIAISELLYVYPLTSSVRTVSRLQFKNLLGGLDTVYFADNIKDLEVTTKDIETSTGYNCYYTFSDNIYSLEINASNNGLAWLQELMLSKVTYFNGVRCTLSDRNMTVQSREFITFSCKVKGERLILN